MPNGPVAVLFILAAWLPSLVEGSKAITSYKAFLDEYSVQRVGDALTYEQRERLFQERLREIEAHNANPDRLWTAGVTQFADYTKAEFEALLGHRPGYRGRSNHAPLSFLQTHESKSRPVSKTLAHSIDWSSAKNKVKDQGGCGSCWAAAAVSAIETNAGIEAKAKGQSIEVADLSIEQLVDCTQNPNECGGKGGCSGATSELAFEALLSPGNGLIPASEYSNGYMSGKWDKKCKKAAGPAAAKKGASLFQAESSQAVTLVQASMAVSIGAWKRLPENDQGALMEALQDYSVVASVDAGGWNAYRAGVFDSCNRNAIVNHAVHLLGYGSEDRPAAGSLVEAGAATTTVHYYLIRNSWGPKWGEEGYLRLKRFPKGSDQYCGRDNKPEEGVYCPAIPSEPKEIEVCGMCGGLSDTSYPMDVKIHDF